jgi:hypothetical protein
MPTSILNPDNQTLAIPSQLEAQPRTQVPLRKKWPRFKAKVKDERLKEEVKRRFGYEPHEWQLQAALKVLEGNDGVVVAGTGKGKTMVFALLGLAVKLSKTKGHYIVVSPLKALEGDQVCPAFGMGMQSHFVYQPNEGHTNEGGKDQGCSPQREHLAEGYFKGLAPRQRSALDIRLT